MDRRKSHLGSVGISHPRGIRQLKNILDLSLSLWLQPACLICKGLTLNGILCEKCNRFQLVKPPQCQNCGDSISFERATCGKCERLKGSLKQVKTLYWLCDSAQRVLHEIKFRSDHPTLTFIAKTHLSQTNILDIPADAWVVPVPLSDSSFFERGFNQSEVLAGRVANNLNLKMVPDALIKVRKTERQSWLNIKERQKNLKNAFIWNEKYTAPNSILLVDDVYTTGSTLKECAKVLKRRNVKDVFAWTLFRTPKK